LKGDKFWTIGNKKTQKCLDVDNAGGKGAIVKQWACKGGNQKKWKILYTSDISVMIMAVHSGMVVDVDVASKRNEDNIHTWLLHAGRNQQNGL
jgi:hypothetical protein